MNSIGDRMKRYERSWETVFPPNSWIAVRIDGRAFHTFTRQAQRPFDSHIVETMVEAAKLVGKEIGGFRLAYHQSDEVTFLFTDTASHQTEHWFGGELNKITSITASAFTGYFNYLINPEFIERKPAQFDARAFLMPKEDAPNLFIWRQQDWERNSVQMLGRAHMSHKQMIGLNREAIRNALLKNHGTDWEKLPSALKHGTFIDRYLNEYSAKMDYGEIMYLIEHTSGPLPAWELES